MEWYRDAPARDGRAPPAGNDDGHGEAVEDGEGGGVQMMLVASWCRVWMNNTVTRRERAYFGLMISFDPWCNSTGQGSI